MSDEPVRVFLVDDQELVRAGFAMILDATPDMTVAGQAADGQQALDVLLAPGAPAVDVVLMDLRMPRVDGVEATRQLRASTSAPAVVVLTTFDADEDVLAALKAGASGFLLKDAGPADLLAAIRAAHRGEAVVAPAVTRRLLDTYVLAPQPDDAPAPPPDGRLDRLTSANGRCWSLWDRGSATRRSPGGSTCRSDGEDPSRCDPAQAGPP